VHFGDSGDNVYSRLKFEAGVHRAENIESLETIFGICYVSRTAWGWKCFLIVKNTADREEASTRWHLKAIVVAALVTSFRLYMYLLFIRFQLERFESCGETASHFVWKGTVCSITKALLLYELFTCPCHEAQ